MAEDQRLPEEFKQELFVEPNGDASMTQSAIGRLVGIAQQNIHKLLVNIATPKNLSEPLEQFAGMNFLATPKVPDYVVGAIVIHYAMYARKKTDKAKKLAVILAGCSIRTLIQRTLGWQPEAKPEKPLSMVEMFSLQAKINEENAKRLNKHDEEIDHLGNLYNLVAHNINVTNQSRLDVFIQVQESELLAEEDPSPVPLRKIIWKLVNKFSLAANCLPEEAWNHFYRELKDRYGFDAQARRKNQKLKFALDAVEQEPGMLENLHRVVSAEFKKLDLPRPSIVDDLSNLNYIEHKKKEAISLDSKDVQKQVDAGNQIYQDKETGKLYTISS
jgi:hypothetical protein